MRFHRLGLVVAAVLGIVGALPSGGSAQYTVTNVTYNAFNTSTAVTCDKPKNAVVYVPTGAATAKYPVHIFLTGTDGIYNEQPALDLLKQTVAKGYLSATVQYDNTRLDLIKKNSCPSLNVRGKCIFSGAESALGKICALPNADCNKGIIVSGVSQGGVLATLAKNHDPRVRAALAFSIGDGLSALWGLATADWKPCVDNGNRTLPSTNLRVVNGNSDDVFGKGKEEGVRAHISRITGITNCTAQDCLTPSGSGYYMVRPLDLSQAGTTTPEHCFMKEGNDCYLPTFNWYFECSDKPWASRDSYDWLTSFGDAEHRPEPPKSARCLTAAPY